MNWHAESAEDTVKRLETSITDGLSPDAARRRLETAGKDGPRISRKTDLLRRFSLQLREPLVFALTCVAVIASVVAVNDPTAGWTEPLVVVGLIILIALIFAFHEQQLDKAEERIRKMSEPQPAVIRGGREQTVPEETIVQGDIITLAAGDLIPADGRLISAEGLTCDERAVTGSSTPAVKDPDAEPHITAPLSERANMVYRGSTVISGSGVAVVTETGADTEAGRQAALLSETDDRSTPLRRQLGEAGKTFALIGLISALIVFIVGFSTRHPNNLKAIEVFMASSALTVLVVPEWIPCLVRTIRIRTNLYMTRMNAIPRPADTAETLGEVSVICTGKAVTMGTRSMTVAKTWVPGGKLAPVSHPGDRDVIRLLEYASLCSEDSSAVSERIASTIEADAAIVSALLELGVKRSALFGEHPRVRTLPAEPEKRLLTVIHKKGDGFIAIAKGSPVRLLPLCDTSESDKVSAICESLGEDALQVFAVGFRELDSGFEPQDVGSVEELGPLTFAGLYALTNPPAVETREAAAECEEAGIRVVMITGDQAATAAAVAGEAGILHAGDEVLTGERLAAMSDDELEGCIRKYSVCAEITPEDKLRIVRAWREAGETVAVTGTTVADLPSLKEADVGCAMGYKGTHAVRDTADVIITDDSFSTITTAIRYGTLFYDNVRKAVRYTVSCAGGRLLAVLAIVIASGTVPLLPVHYLLLYLLTMFLPTLAFAEEPPEYGTMLMSPRRSTKLFGGDMIFSVCCRGLFIAALAAAAYFIGAADNAAAGRTMTFAVMSISASVFSLPSRTDDYLLDAGLLSNPVMLISVGASIVLTALLVLIPMGWTMLEPLSGAQLGIALALSLSPLVVCELGKMLIRYVRH